MKKLLIGSPIKQKAAILKVFLENLCKMNYENMEVTYFFIDDNVEKESTELLKKFKNENNNVILKSYTDYDIKQNEAYITDETHSWKQSLIERITTFKDSIIQYAQNNNFDYLFLVDSDIIMNKETILHLIERQVDIVSEIFWTSWNPGDNLVPQVWLQDESSLYIRNWNKQYTELEKKQLNKDFIAKMKIPGIYEVGGLGACTLISKEALSYPLSFKTISNISFWGEDRHFCIRAKSFGLKLYVDTVYPAYHIYRESYLSGVKDYLQNGFDPNHFVYNPLERRKKTKKIKLKEKLTKLETKLKMIYKEYKKAKFLSKRVINKNNTITLSMVVHNEEQRYLKEMLEHTKKYIDKYVIIDDASTDNTVKLCEEILKDKPHKIIKNTQSMFSNEYLLRKKQWNETIKTDPDWIMFLDADEIFEDKIINIKYMIKNDEVDAYCFRLYDMWKPGYYRADKYWNAHNHYRPFLIRYQPNFHYKFIKAKQHCGRMPKNVLRLNYINSDIRLKHLGWLRDEDKKKKYSRYLKLDKDGINGNLEQYNSILDKEPNLEKFEENNEN